MHFILESAFLPKYPPDLNDIEHDFSALKRARMYAKPDTSLDDIIREHCVSYCLIARGIWGDPNFCYSQ
jgi:transposase